MFVKVDPKPSNLGGFKDSKQFNIKGTQRPVYMHPQCKPDDSFYRAL